MSINSSGDWSTSGVPDWISLNITSGTMGPSIMSVTASENNSTESGRSGSFLIVNGINDATITLSQANKIIQNTLNVTPSSLYFDWTGGTKYLNVSDMDYTWTATSKPNWVVLSQTSGAQGYSMVGVTASENSGDTTRSGDLIFSDGHNTATVSLGQPMSSTTKTFSISPAITYVENSGGTPIIHIYYGNRNGDDVALSSSESWCRPTYVQWTGDSGNVVVNVDRYGVNLEREAVITATAVLDSSLSATTTMRQKALPFINLNPVYVEFEQSGGTATITLESNTDWIIDIDNIE